MRKISKLQWLVQEMQGHRLLHINCPNRLDTCATAQIYRHLRHCPNAHNLRHTLALYNHPNRATRSHNTQSCVHKSCMHSVSEIAPTE